MYAISVDTGQMLVEVVLGGTLSVAETDAYMAELRAALTRHALAGDYRIVVDVGGCTIQTQDMIRAMGAHMAAMPPARAVAVVTPSPLARLQARRLFTQAHARVVADRADALAWVLHGREPGAGGAAA